MQATCDLGLQPGDVLEGKYVVRERIGQGGMSNVFLADQPDLERQVAIKILRPELAERPAHARRIRKEAVAACHVRSPHCVAVIDRCILPDGTPYIVLEYVPGQPLARVIAGESIPLPRVVDLLGQILSALGAAHDSGIVHGDVKSDNFLVQRVDGGDHVTMIDFGLARVAGAPVEVDLEEGEPMVSGTPEYMAPEVIRGEPPTPASDLYGAGVILYELVTGTRPFEGGSALETVMQHVRDAVVPPSLRRPERNISPALDRVVLRALEKRPEARFADAATFARELRAAAAAAAAAEAVAEAPRAVADRPDARPASARARMCATAVRRYLAEVPRKALLAAASVTWPI